tara:strand:- start:846 stop:995 length:150 start_codon:yes stop_codon:yes gene_type:complete
MNSFWEGMATLGQVSFIYMCLCILTMWAYMVFVLARYVLINIIKNIKDE